MCAMMKRITAIARSAQTLRSESRNGFTKFTSRSHVSRIATPVASGFEVTNDNVGGDVIHFIARSSLPPALRPRAGTLGIAFGGGAEQD